MKAEWGRVGRTPLRAWRRRAPTHWRPWGRGIRPAWWRSGRRPCRWLQPGRLRHNAHGGEEEEFSPAQFSFFVFAARPVAQLTCDGVDGSDWEQQNDSDVDVPLQGQLDEQSAGVHVHLREENTGTNMWKVSEKWQAGAAYRKTSGFMPEP